MFQRIIDDIKDGAGHASRLASLAIATSVLGLATIGFLAAAAFLYVLNTYGAIAACLTVAGIFFVLALMTGIALMSRGKPQPREERREAPPSPLKSALADPMLLATGLQIARTVGLKRLLPLLALAGVAVGVLASRGRSSDESDDDENVSG